MKAEKQICATPRVPKRGSVAQIMLRPGHHGGLGGMVIVVDPRAMSVAGRPNRCPRLLVIRKYRPQGY